METGRVVLNHGNHTGGAAVEAATASEPSCLVPSPTGPGGSRPDAGGSPAVEQPQTHLHIFPASPGTCVSPPAVDTGWSRPHAE